MPVPDAIFHTDGEALVPTGLARGPWYPDTQHGSPMLGLLARSVERVPSERPVQVTRLTSDLLRAAPLAAVTTRARVLRRGSSVEWIEAELLAGDELCARATALRFRVAEVGVPHDVEWSGGSPPPLPESAGRFGWEAARDADDLPALHHALELRPVPGFEAPTAWMRLKVPLVAGEADSPLVRTAVVSDFTYTVPFIRAMSRDREALARRPFVAINPDTTLNLHRMPEGEWICLDARATYDAVGAGTATARLFDARGAIGQSSQSLLVRGLEARPESWKRYAK